jgi:hypothetical protein
MAFVYAARAYNSSRLVTLAENIWMQTAVYQISASDAASGTHPLRSVQFQKSCNGSEQSLYFSTVRFLMQGIDSLAGGVLCKVGNTRYGCKDVCMLTHDCRMPASAQTIYAWARWKSR